MIRDTLGRGRRLAATVSLTSCLLLVGFAGTALASDYDGDGSSTPADCNDFDAAIHPGAVDKPDIAFEDTNCDGIDGDVSQAIFVDGGGGLDTRSGTKDFPKKTISNAIIAAKAAGKDVYVAAGTYPESLTLDTNVSIYGGYTPNFSARTLVEPTIVTGDAAGRAGRRQDRHHAAASDPHRRRGRRGHRAAAHMACAWSTTRRSRSTT